jgi:hypothetical protein
VYDARLVFRLDETVDYVKIQVKNYELKIT